MIQFNLLPDVKLEYIKAQRLKRLTISAAVLFALSCMALAVLLFVTVNIVQKNHMKSLNGQINKIARVVKGTPDIDKILTLQNQLISLPTLHSTKPAATRLFGYLSQVTPSNVTISSIMVDFSANTFLVSGQAKDLLAVNTFVDTLKFTGYKTPEGGETVKNAFSKVVLSGFNVNDKNATYQIALSYDPIIFDIKTNPALNVPNGVTTRESSNQPSALFEQGPTAKKKE